MTMHQFETVHMRPGQGQRAYRVINEIVTLKALAQDTAGAYTMFEVWTPPQGGPPPHIQRYEDESFYVLEGLYIFRVGDQTLEVGPGEFVLVPRGTPHTYTNDSSRLGRMLVVNSPGGLSEQFFAEIGEPIEYPELPLPPAGFPNVAKIVASAQKYGIEMLPPLPA